MSQSGLRNPGGRARPRRGTLVLEAIVLLLAIQPIRCWTLSGAGWARRGARRGGAGAGGLMRRPWAWHAAACSRCCWRAASCTGRWRRWVIFGGSGCTLHVAGRSCAGRTVAERLRHWVMRCRGRRVAEGRRPQLQPLALVDRRGAYVNRTPLAFSSSYIASTSPTSRLRWTTRRFMGATSGRPQHQPGVAGGQHGVAVAAVDLEEAEHVAVERDRAVQVGDQHRDADAVDRAGRGRAGRSGRR